MSQSSGESDASWQEPRWRVAGLVSPLRGNERRLFPSQSAVWVNQQVRVARGLSWGRTDFSPPLTLEDQHQQLVRPLIDLEVEEGECVWIAGPEFSRAYEPLSDVIGDQWGLLDWQHHEGWRFSAGPYSGLLDVCAAIARRARALLETSISSKESITDHHSWCAYTLHGGLEGIDPKERLLVKALYHYLMADGKAYFRVLDDVGARWGDADADIFDRQVERLTRFLSRRRPGSVGGRLAARLAYPEPSSNADQESNVIDAINGNVVSLVPRRV